MRRGEIPLLTALSAVRLAPAANAYSGRGMVWATGLGSISGEENPMQSARIAFLAALIACVFCGGRVAAQNLLTDPSFENPVLFTADGPPFVGSWEAFNGGAGSSAVNDTLLPHTGARDAHFNITATNNTF